MSDLAKKLCFILILSSLVFINTTCSAKETPSRIHIKSPSYPHDVRTIFPSLQPLFPQTTKIKNASIFLTVLLLYHYFQYQYLNKLSAIETSKQTSTTTKLGQLGEKYIKIDEQIEAFKRSKDPVKGAFSDKDQQEFIKELYNGKKKILQKMYQTYKQNTTLLQRVKNAFLWISNYEENDLEAKT